MSINEDWICIVRLELPKCPHVYGQSPCTATGNQCYNTWNTCNDKCNYTCSKSYIYFSSCITPPHFDFCAYPVIDAGSLSRSRLTSEPGKSFSSQRYLNMTLNDIASDGTGIDPYWPRGAIPIQTANSPGSLLGRLEQIHKYFQGYKAEVFTGYCSQAFENLRREVLMIDEFSGTPDKCDGQYNLSLIDPLAVAGDAVCSGEEECYAASSAVGNEQLITPTLGIDLDSATDQQGSPFQWVGNPIFTQNLATYIQENIEKLRHLKYIQIGSEILEIQICENDSAPAGYNGVLVDRGLCGTDVAKHEAGVKITFLQSFENTHVADAVERLFCECTDLNGLLNLCCDDQQYAVIDRESFDAFKCANPYHIIPFRIMRKGEGIRKNLNELELLFGFSIYSDPECGAVKLKQCRKPNITGRVIECSQIELISITRGDSYQSILVNHSPNDCTKAVSEDNKGGTEFLITRDAARKPCDRRESRTNNTFELSTAWITAENLFLLKASMWRFFKKHNCPMREPQIRVANETALGLSEGDGVGIESSSIIGPDGEYDTDTVFEIVEIVAGKEYTDICLVENPYDENTQDCLADESVIYESTDDCQESDCLELF